MKGLPSRRRIEVNLDELDRIIDHGTNAPLSKEDGQKIKAALHAMAERLTAKRSTEKTAAILPKPAVPDPEKELATDEPPVGHGRNGAVTFTGADRVFVPHATLQPGVSCPECGAGKVYRQKNPATQVRIVGQAPLKTTVFEMERLRCNACGEIFTAEQPDRVGPDKYDATAIAMIALLKYGTGLPFKRLEKLERQFGMPLPAATQWELVASAAEPLRPALEEFISQAAQGSVLHNDDTSMRILRLTREPGDKRTGTFTSGIVSIVGAWRIALFFTGPKHAGENIGEVLKRASTDFPRPSRCLMPCLETRPSWKGSQPCLPTASRTEGDILWR